MDDKHFFKLILDKLSKGIIVAKLNGEIIFANKKSESLLGEKVSTFIANKDIFSLLKGNYQKLNFSEAHLQGITEVLENDREEFQFEYSVSLNNQLRHFSPCIQKLSYSDQAFILITYAETTEQKAAEAEVLFLSRRDGLTELANRRYFNEFFLQEWERCCRLNTPLSLALLDIDHFKLLNDHYGHVKGDQCLKAVADLLKDFTKRPTDLAARYGGEEFVLVYGNMEYDDAYELMSRLIDSVRELEIEHELSPVHQYLTASIGLVTLFPIKGDDINPNAILEEADICLYSAKRNGRDQLVTFDHTVREMSKNVG